MTNNIFERKCFPRNNRKMIEGKQNLRELINYSLLKLVSESLRFIAELNIALSFALQYCKDILSKKTSLIFLLYSERSEISHGS